MRPTTVVSSTNLMMWLELNLAVQSWVSSVKSSGLSTQPCGAPVLSVVVLEVLWPTRTDWGLLVRKSRIQLQRELLRPSRFSLFMSCCGIIVLNASWRQWTAMNSSLSGCVCICWEVTKGLTLIRTNSIYSFTVASSKEQICSCVVLCLLIFV